MAFRMAQTIFEMRDNPELRASLSEYIAFILFPPTLLAGPINPFSYHRKTSDGRFVSLENLSVGALRISIGYIKLRFLSTLLYQLTFSANWTEGFRHDWIDLIISGACYYLYLYLNFSGYSDIAIGIAAMIGIRVKENFDNPLVSRNIKDFWRRWHISLTDFVREAVFTPLSMALVRTFGVRFLTPAVLIAIAATFIVLALWHGVAAGYFIFYSLHATAFAVNQLLEDRRRRRDKAFQKRYADRQSVKVGSQILTFVFLAFTFAFVDLETWEKIKSAWLLIE